MQNVSVVVLFKDKNPCILTSCSFWIFYFFLLRKWHLMAFNIISCITLILQMNEPPLTSFRCAKITEDGFDLYSIFLYPGFRVIWDFLIYYSLNKRMSCEGCLLLPFSSSPSPSPLHRRAAASLCGEWEISMGLIFL